MAENTKIEWCEFTFNPWRGCTKVSAGCARCYAETMSGRNPSVLGMWGPNGTRVVASEAQWKLPVKWNKLAGLADRHNNGPHERPRVFCASLADVFEDWQGPMVDSQGNVLDSQRSRPMTATAASSYDPLTMQDVRCRLFRLIDATPNLDWLLLTKRPENVNSMMSGVRDRNGLDQHKISRILGSTIANPPAMPKNVWLGTSVENQAAADERIPHLLRVPAAVRFLSCEPLLGPVRDKSNALFPGDPSMARGWCWAEIDWAIVGGESGPGARPCRVEWIRGIVKQCQAAGVPVFVKQLGGNINTGPHDAEEGAFPRCRRCGHFDFGPCPDGTLLCNGCDDVWRGLRDKKGGDMTEWPADLRVREFPKGAVPA